MGVDSSRERVAAENPIAPAPFQAHVELLRLFLAHREGIVENIEGVLNAQRKPVRHLQDHAALADQIESCFFAGSGAVAGQRPLRGELEEAHWARGFKPRPVQDLHNDLIHPAEMMIRGFYCWQRTRWPGRNARLHYAHTLFNLDVLRYLQLLSMRLWDADPFAGQAGGQGSAGARLAEIQSLLDQLWSGSPASQPAIVRDARWLIPLAQSLITDELAPYFEVARQVAETLPEADALEVQKAHVRMLGGHLTSQIRYYCTKDRVSINENSVILRTRASNALDMALLVHGLVELLKAYDRAVRSSDERMRLDLAGAIFQGLSPDPELFLNRIDLLSAYSMIEHVVIAPAATIQATYSAMGQRHVRLLHEYAALINRVSHSLHDDLPHFRPVDGGYSPLGAIFGLPSHLIEHMALKALQHDAETRFSLEDVFQDGDARGNSGAEKLAWVNGWRQLPHIDREIQHLYDYPHEFAAEIYGRIEHEFRRRASNTAASGGMRTGRLCVEPGDIPRNSAIPELPERYSVSSDKRIVAAHKAEPYDPAQLQAGRREGHFLVSYETPGGWMALKKDLLTEVLGAGRDARVAGLPPEAAGVLRLMCAGLVMPENPADPAGAPRLIEQD